MIDYREPGRKPDIGPLRAGGNDMLRNLKARAVQPGSIPVTAERPRCAPKGQDFTSHTPVRRNRQGASKVMNPTRYSRTVGSHRSPDALALVVKEVEVGRIKADGDVHVDV